MGNSKSEPSYKSPAANATTEAAAATTDQLAAPAVSIISTDFSKDYAMKREIGSGYTAKCYICQEKQTSKFYACKVVDKKKLRMKSGKNPKLFKRLVAEIEICKAVRHPNIVQVYKVYENSIKVFIVMELMSGGELFDHIIDRGRLDEAEAIAIVRKLCDAINYLHERNIIHRDLKPENILLKRPNNIDDIRIIDFGMSKVFEKGASGHRALAKTYSLLGTPGYMAPEIMKSESYTKAVDLWSLGVVTYVLLCGYMPFDESHGAKTRWAMDFPREEWDTISGAARDFVQQLLTANPDKRMTAAGALKHMWLSPQTGGGVPRTPLPSPKRMRKRKKSAFSFDEAPASSKKDEAPASSKTVE